MTTIDPSTLGDIPEDSDPAVYSGHTVCKPIDALRIPAIVVPPTEIVAAFSSIAEEARSRRENLIKDSRALEALRDTLLPKLVSGDVRVKVVP